LGLVGWGIARDLIALTPNPRTGLKALAEAFGLFERLVKAILLL
jgi:hypothetical protein